MLVSSASSHRQRRPNYLGELFLYYTDASYSDSIYCSAYVVHAKGLKTNAEKAAFSKQVHEWVGSRVAKHKFLRGGIIIIEAIPKRYVPNLWILRSTH